VAKSLTEDKNVARNAATFHMPNVSKHYKKPHITMSKLVQVLLIFAILISCTTIENGKDKLSSNKIESLIAKDTIANLSIGSLVDSGLIVSVNKYKIVCNFYRNFKELEIPIRVCATFEASGFGNIDSFIVNYDGVIHNLKTSDYFIQSPREIIAIKNSRNFGIRIIDFNFDNQPDIAIYNSASGMKNIAEDIYIYGKTKKRFIYNQILSESSNCTVDTIRNLIETFGQGGMASMIYNSETYTWEEEKLKKIREVRQDYNDELKRFIKVTKDLVDNNWVTSTDTLTEERILEMREGK